MLKHGDVMSSFLLYYTGLSTNLAETTCTRHFDKGPVGVFIKKKKIPNKQNQKLFKVVVKQY